MQVLIHARKPYVVLFRREKRDLCRAIFKFHKNAFHSLEKAKFLNCNHCFCSDQKILLYDSSTLKRESDRLE